MRLVAAVFSAPTPGDDVGRAAAACRWAMAPAWEGLSGIWPPVHTYLLGGLMRLGGSPWLWTHAVGWVTTTAALPLFFMAVRDLYGDVRRAALATLLLALYYVHIWMAGTAFAEAPYTCALFASLAFAARAARRAPGAGSSAALASGVAMAVALLFRHEAKLVWVVVLVWLVREAGRRAAVRYAVPSLAVIAWQMVEAARAGGVGHDMQVVMGMKLAEVALHGSRLEALERWVVMPAGSPSVVIVVLGLAGLWMTRAAWRRDLWGWLFVVQSAVFLGLTVYPGWQPYLRYLFLYVVCLLPHAAAALHAIARRRRDAAVALVLLALLVQSIAWQHGRNEGRGLGWLPIYRPAPQQATLDAWVRTHPATDRVLALEGYPEAWDVYASLISIKACEAMSRFRSVSYDDRLGLARGQPLDVRGYDVVLLNPSSSLFEAAWNSLPPGRRVEHRDARLAIVRLTP